MNQSHIYATWDEADLTATRDIWSSSAHLIAYQYWLAVLWKFSNRGLSQQYQEMLGMEGCDPTIKKPYIIRI